MVGKRVQFDSETWEATEGVLIESLYGVAVVRDTLMSLIVVGALGPLTLRPLYHAATIVRVEGQIPCQQTLNCQLLNICCHQNY
jgi:hypothetical protein